MSFEIKKAIRSGVTPLIGINGRTGLGKTKSALLLARGLVGPSGKILGIDTENKRMSHFADESPIAPYDVIDLDEPFTSQRYHDAIMEAIKGKYDVCVVDSASHEWAGPGGMLEYREQWLDEKTQGDWGKRERMNMLAWGEIAKRRANFLNLVLRCPIPLIMCFRVKNKVTMPKDGEQPGNPKQKEKYSVDVDVPVTRADLSYEMFWVINMEENEAGGGFFKVKKPGPDSLRRMIAEVGLNRISIAHGAALREWCRGTAIPSNQTGQSAKKPTDPLAELKAKLRGNLATLGLPIPQPKADKTEVAKCINTWEDFLISKHIMEPGQSLAGLTIEQLTKVNDMAEILIQESKQQ